MFNVDSLGNVYFPAGVSVANYPITLNTPTHVLVAGVGGRISKVATSQLISNTDVTSVFGRTGDIIALPGDYTSEMIKEVNNLYFTIDRARSAISLTALGTSGPATYNPTTGVINVPQYQNEFNGVTTFNGRPGDVVLTALDVTTALTYTPLASETDPIWTAEKPLYYTKVETQTYVTTQISNLVDSAPTTLDTLNELAAALGDDPNFATTVTNLIATKEPTIAPGTTSQYWRGDKTWQTLPIYTLAGLGGQPQLNGTGFVKASGTTISYDNSTYYLASNPAGYITGITSGMVTTALGYTPYNASNPNGYITSASIGNGTLTLNVSGNGLSGSTSFTANQSGGSTFTVTSNATTSASANTLVYRDSSADIYTRYFLGSYINTSDNDESSITRFVIKNGDNYHRSATTTVAANIIRGVASGTWSINITGNAGSITNQANSATITASTGVNANHIVQRDGNGYIYANHINFNTSESENPSINSFFVSNGDGWSRKATIAHVRNQLGNYGGWITGISSTMVINALGYTPYNSTNPSGYITGINSTMVTNALGYTPYNSSNPSGYISGYTETDTLASVTSRGSVTSTTITAANFITSSDRRVKSEITNIENPFEILDKINSYEYIKDGNKEAGFIAQEVQEAIPYAVFEGDNGMLTMSDRPVLAYLFAAVMELKEENTILKEKLGL